MREISAAKSFHRRYLQPYSTSNPLKTGGFFAETAKKFPWAARSGKYLRNCAPEAKS
jgi:hypothetical protein